MARAKSTICCYCNSYSVIDNYCVECESTQPVYVPDPTPTKVSDAPPNPTDDAYGNYTQSFDPTEYPDSYSPD